METLYTQTPIVDDNDNSLKTKELTKKQKNRIIRLRFSKNNSDLKKWYAKQLHVNELIGFEFEWRNRYFPNMAIIAPPEFIQSLKTVQQPSPHSVSIRKTYH